MFDLNIPEKIKPQAVAHHEAITRLRIAETQVRMWQEEFMLATKLQKITEIDWTNALNRYDPTTGEIVPDSKIQLTEAKGTT